MMGPLFWTGPWTDFWDINTKKYTGLLIYYRYLVVLEWLQTYEVLWAPWF